MNTIYNVFVLGLFCAVCSSVDLEHFRSELRSGLRQKLFEIQGNRIALSVRQSHQCYTNCSYRGSFSDTITQPPNCTVIQSNVACHLEITVNYTSSTVVISSSSLDEYFGIDVNIVDKAEAHYTYFDYESSVKYHSTLYYCTSGDNCAWTYAKEIISKLTALNYDPLYNSLSEKLINSGTASNVVQCYNSSNELVSCPNGICWYYSPYYETSEPRDCDIFNGYGYLITGSVYFIVGTNKNSSNFLGFNCNIDQCNSDANVNEIKEIIRTQGNEYINYGTSSTSTSTTSAFNDNTTSTGTSTTSAFNDNTTSTGTSTTSAFDNTTSNSIEIQLQCFYIVLCSWTFLF